MKNKWWENWKDEDATPDIYILTKFPPKEHLSTSDLSKIPAHFKPESEQDLNSQFWVFLIGHGVAFKKTKNPIYAIEVFCFAHERGVYPPVWVLDYMAEIFNDWRKLGGTKSLDELFELKPLQGQSPLYKTDAEERRDERLCNDVFILKHYFGFTVEEACHMVARQLEDDQDWNKTQFKLKAIKDDTIKDRYKRKWRKIYKTLYADGTLVFPEESRIPFLEQFPKDSFPLNKPLHKMIKK